MDKKTLSLLREFKRIGLTSEEAVKSTEVADIITKTIDEEFGNKIMLGAITVIAFAYIQTKFKNIVVLNDDEDNRI